MQNGTLEVVRYKVYGSLESLEIMVIIGRRKM